MDGLMDGWMDGWMDGYQSLSWLQANGSMLRVYLEPPNPNECTWRAPEVPFLNPIGIERPEASSRCSCDLKVAHMSMATAAACTCMSSTAPITHSVVRAPMAPQEIRSAMYCGETVSRNSVPAGRPEYSQCAVSCCCCQFSSTTTLIHFTLL